MGEKRPTMPNVVAGMRVLAGIEVNRMYEDRPEWVVLCDRESDHDRYIVWRIWYDPMTGELIRHSGNYLSDFRRAINVFGERGGILAETNDHVRTLEDMVKTRDELIDELQADIDQYIAQGDYIKE